jgi:hypothetical protein
VEDLKEEVEVEVVLVICMTVHMIVCSGVHGSGAVQSHSNTARLVVLCNPRFQCVWCTATD